MVRGAAAGLRNMLIFNGRNLERRRWKVQRRRQLAGKTERLRRGDRFVEGLHLLEHLLGLAGVLFRAALDVVAEQCRRLQERSQRRQVLGHLRAHDVGDGTRQFPEHQERLNAVASVHREGSVSGLSPWPREDRESRLRLAAGLPLVNDKPHGQKKFPPRRRAPDRSRASPRLHARRLQMAPGWSVYRVVWPGWIAGLRENPNDSPRSSGRGRPSRNLTGG